jgi:RsiW-degrading membrane proteinase PrsW (M82 family)
MGGIEGDDPEHGDDAPLSGRRTRALASISTPDDNERDLLMAGCGCVVLGLLALGSLGFLLSSLGQMVMVAEHPTIGLAALLAALVVAVPYTAVVFWLDRNEKEPYYLLVATFVWGAFLATSVSALFNALVGATMGQFAMVSLSAPIFEEITKGLAVATIFVFFSKHFDNVLDGIIYGAIAGLGFATYENFTYYLRIGSQEGMSALMATFWLRGVLSGLGTHATFTALLGGALGLFRVLRSGTWRWFLPPLGLGAAMFTHFLWNTFAGLFIEASPDGATMPMEMLLVSAPKAVAVLQMPFLLFVVVTSVLALRHEARLIQEQLADEVPQILDREELDHLVPARHRAFRSLKLFVSGDFQRWRATRRRNHKLIELAFEKWHMDHEEKLDDPEAAQRHAARVIELRRELQ